MTNFGGTTMYWGCSGGSMSKALRHMEEPDVLLSYATNTTPWDEIKNLFIDSGGFSLMLEKGKHDPVEDYMGFVQQHGADTAALQDYPCEPGILQVYDRTVSDHQHMSVERAAENLAYIQDHGIDVEPVAVLQGWDTDDYIRCIDMYRDAGVLTDRVAVGSVCRRNAESDIRSVLNSVRAELPNRPIHAFGVKKTILKYPDMQDALDSVDSSAWYFGMYQNKPVPERAWHTCVKMYLDYKRDLYDSFNQSIQAKDGQNTLGVYQ